MSKAAQAKPWTHAEIGAALGVRYDAPRYAYFSEVYHHVGYGRHADGIAVAMWRSLGLYIHGFEIKAHRSDWLREMKKPEKADGIFPYCDFWWLATADESLCKPEELPPDWGLITVRGSGLHTVKAAKKLKADKPDRDFLCSIIRLAYTKVISPPRLREEYQRGRKDQEASNQYEVDRRQRDLDDCHKAIADFEKASGVKIERWGAEDIGRAVRTVLDGGHLQYRADLERLKTRAEQIAADITKRLEGAE